MARVTKPLEKFCPEFSAREDNFLPIEVKGNNEAIAINHVVEVPSAQVKSALILAAINAYGESEIIENSATRDHTERMMQYLGFDLKVKQDGNKNIITINATEDLEAKDITVSGDPSSAAFFSALTLLNPKSSLKIKNICLNSTRIE